ncbi:serine protease [Streptomyces sp. CAU 1734]|uniref:serine protease n=1 Tax=Streptomyces sp. CAU 1734 TaxID=3140360 RepID=UPI0032602155
MAGAMNHGDPELPTLVDIRDLAGRPRGTGFAADRLGTVVTSHETIDGLARAVLHAPGARTCLAEAADITPLPAYGLALVRTEGLGLRPVPISARKRIDPGTPVRLPARGWYEARVLRSVPVTYTATDRFHLIAEAAELLLGPGCDDMLRLGSEAAGGPVLDAATGAALAVLGTALQSGRRAAGFALPLCPLGGLSDGPLPVLLRRNAATVPGHGDDLNLAAVLELTAGTLGPGLHSAAEQGGRRALTDPGGAGGAGAAPGLVLALTGAPGTGRTTELAALAARRARGPEPAPTVWLRGADLRTGDTSVADAVARALRRAGRGLTASQPARATGNRDAVTPERVAHLAQEAGRPLLVVLDGPEEMPPPLARRLPEWTAGTVHWLSTRGAGLAIGCRPEYWEYAAPLHPPGAVRLPAAHLGDLGAAEAERVRARYGIPPGSIADADARHPLALRLLAEVREALPGEVPGCPAREEIFAAHLALVCLRTAVRVAAGSPSPPGGRAVRRLAAGVSGRVHEAARRCLGAGQGALDRESFEELFPWRSGWAAAVLTEGLLVPAGTGYRFAHEEVAEWIQGAHLDLDAALYSLVHRRHTRPPRGLPARPGTRLPGSHVPPPPGSAGSEPPTALPVPRHRIGPVVQALLLLDRVHGPPALTRRLRELVEAVDLPAGTGDPLWWGAQLLARTLLRLPDPSAYLPVLHLLAERVTRRSVRGGPDRPAGTGLFGPWFWLSLRVSESDRLDLLRRLIPADGPPPGALRPPPSGTLRTPPPDARTPARPRFLDAVAALLEADPVGVQPLLCRWFIDGTPLPVTPGAEQRPTVAVAAQALLHSRRTLAVDDLTEALLAANHPRAGELLLALAEDEPSALARAVDRWAHDPRPSRRAAAAAHAPAVAPHITTGAQRLLLRHAALALLGRPDDPGPHGAALALLVRDPHTRSRHLERALDAFAAAGPAGPPALALMAAVETHPEQVLAAFRARLRTDTDAVPVLTALADTTTLTQARRAAALVTEHLDRHPSGAPGAAAFVDRRLEHGPAVRSVLFPLVSEMLRERPHRVGLALAPVLAAPGTARSGPLRRELLAVLLDALHDRARPCTPGTPDADPDAATGEAVLESLLRAAALGCTARPEARTRELTHRTGVLLARTPDGAHRFDQQLIRLAREVPGFAARVAGWVAHDPGDWSPLIAPETRRALETLGSPMPMRTAGRGHGSLRPA